MSSLVSLDQDSKQQTQEKINKWIKEQEAMAVYVKHDDLSPCNVEKQMGQKLWPHEFDLRLKKLNPSLFSEVNTFNRNKRMLYIMENGKKRGVCPFENTVMPEHSIVAVKEERYPDPNLPRDNEGNPLYDRTEANKDPDNYGWITQLIPWHEAFRGWRTVLIKLVKEGIATPTQIETIFGSSDTTGWAYAMGKRDTKLTPW